MSANKANVHAEPGKQEIVITREFDAPRELVFKVITDPALVPQWWGPRRLTTEVDKMDVRPGGQWRFVHRDAEGNTYGFHGVYHEILAPERIIDTFEFEGLPETGHVTLETMKLEALPGGRTRLITQSVFQSVADRDGMLQSGMEEGVHDMYDRLEELAQKM
ncbi:MAG TPA: SRPBCC family protein [Ktedonobacteraceae bacterium]|nr:SRPBCC family protein [Ktedonobacteraceae bacterium]